VVDNDEGFVAAQHMLTELREDNARGAHYYTRNPCEGSCNTRNT